MRRGRLVGRPLLVVGVRRCPTLPHCFRCSTIGAGGLNDRVRDGTGCFPYRYDHRDIGRDIDHGPAPHSPARVGVAVWGGGGSRSCSGNRTVDANIMQPWGCVQVARPISTSRLRTLRCFHLWPINPVVWLGALQPRGVGRPHLEEGFPLRCFQRLSRPNVANQPCTWRYNWHTRGSSVPVLSY